MEKIKVLELFGGIGACSKALERLNIPYEISDYVEIDKYAVASFNAMHNTHFSPQDIQLWDKDIKVDLIMHGSPCQDFSLAGKQAGGDEGSGTRSSLMYETLRIVEKLKPKYVIWENVKNIISKKHKHNFDNYLERMHDLGYISDYKVLNAKDYGIPQNRERVFTISILTDLYDFEFPPKQELELKLKDMLEDNVDEKYFLSKKLVDCFMSDGTGGYPRRERFLSNVNKKNTDVANAIITTEGNKPTCNFIKTDTRNMKEQLCDKLIDENMVKENDVIRHSYSQSRMDNFYTQNKSNNDICPTLDTRCDCLGVTVKDTDNYIEWKEKGKFESDTRAFKEEKISGAITTDSKNKVLLDSNNKRLIETIENIDFDKDVSYVDSYNRNIRKDDLSGTITTGVDFRNNTFLAIKNATKKGYLEATEGDGVDISSRMEYHRGTVQKDMIQTLDSQGGNNKGVVVLGNYMPSGYDSSRIVDNNGLAPTVKENHGTVTATQTLDLRIRKLTPRECWRLMGFDDKDFDKASEVNSNTQLYKQAGNSIVVNVLMAIFSNLLRDEMINNE